MLCSPYAIDRGQRSAILAVLMMVLSAVVRTVYYAVCGGTAGELAVYWGLPVGAAVIFAAVVLFWGETHVWVTVISVLMGVVFFIVKATTFADALHTGLCIVLYLAVLVIYSLTLFGIIPTKKLLYPLFGLPLAYHILVEDVQLYLLAEPPVPPIAWLPEISVLLIMGALLALSFALRRRDQAGSAPESVEAK